MLLHILLSCGLFLTGSSGTKLTDTVMHQGEYTSSGVYHWQGKVVMSIPADLTEAITNWKMVIYLEQDREIRSVAQVNYAGALYAMCPSTPEGSTANYFILKPYNAGAKAVSAGSTLQLDFTVKMVGTARPQATAVLIVNPTSALDPLCESQAPDSTTTATTAVDTTTATIESTSTATTDSTAATMTTDNPTTIETTSTIATDATTATMTTDNPTTVTNTSVTDAQTASITTDTVTITQSTNTNSATTQSTTTQVIITSYESPSSPTEVNAESTQSATTIETTTLLTSEAIDTSTSDEGTTPAHEPTTSPYVYRYRRPKVRQVEPEEAEHASIVGVTWSILAIFLILFIASVDLDALIRDIRRAFQNVRYGFRRLANIPIDASDQNYDVQYNRQRRIKQKQRKNRKDVTLEDISTHSMNLKNNNERLKSSTSYRLGIVSNKVAHREDNDMQFRNSYEHSEQLGPNEADSQIYKTTPPIRSTWNPRGNHVNPR